jgi:hypothetical protein
MQIDGMDFLDWLHKTRRESEEERKRKGIDEVAWLRQIAAEAKALKEELARSRPPVAPDRKTGD